VKLGSELSIPPVFAVLLLIESHFLVCFPQLLKTQAASMAVAWLPRFGSPHSVCGKQPSSRTTAGFLMVNILQLPQSFAVTCMIQHRCKTRVSKQKRRNRNGFRLWYYLSCHPSQASVAVATLYRYCLL